MIFIQVPHTIKKHTFIITILILVDVFIEKSHLNMHQNIVTFLLNGT